MKKIINFFKNRRVLENLAIIGILASLTAVGFVGTGAVGVFKPESSKPIYRGNALGGAASLMINVYWGTEYLDGMLNVLKEKGVKTTFFVGGTWVNDNPDMLRRIIAEGHEIGNHGFFHKSHDKLGYDKNLEEMRTCHTIVKSVAGYDMTLFAPPSGAYGDATMNAAREMGYKVIMWSRDTIDWRDKDAEICYKRATKDIKSGELVLMHPTKHTLEALPRIIDYYISQSIKPTTVTAALS